MPTGTRWSSRGSDRVRPRRSRVEDVILEERECPHASIPFDSRHMGCQQMGCKAGDGVLSFYC